MPVLKSDSLLGAFYKRRSCQLPLHAQVAALPQTSCTTRRRESAQVSSACRPVTVQACEHPSVCKLRLLSLADCSGCLCGVRLFLGSGGAISFNAVGGCCHELAVGSLGIVLVDLELLLLRLRIRDAFRKPVQNAISTSALLLHLWTFGFGGGATLLCALICTRPGVQNFLMRS